MIIPATLSSPSITFSPVSIDNIKRMDITTQVTLLVKNRYCHMDSKSFIIYFYLELTDKINSYILPVKYYEWLGATECGTVICDYVKLSDGNMLYNCLEIATLNKPNIDIKEKVDAPLANGCLVLMESYTKHYRDKGVVTRVLNRGNANLVTGVGMASILDNSVYVRAMCKLSLLTENVPVEIAYRKLTIDEIEYCCDLEVVK